MKHTINTKKIYMNSIETTFTSLTQMIPFLARNTSELNSITPWPSPSLKEEGLRFFLKRFQDETTKSKFSRR